MAATAIKTVRSIFIREGLDGHSWEVEPHPDLLSFEGIRALHTSHEPDARFFGSFYVVTQGKDATMAIRPQDGVFWVRHTSAQFSLMELYEESRRNLTITTLKVIRIFENVI